MGGFYYKPTILYAKAVNFFFYMAIMRSVMLMQYKQGNVTQKCCIIELFQHKIDTYKRTLRMGYWLILLEFFKKVYKN